MSFRSIVEVFLPVAVLLIAAQVAKINGRNSERFGTVQCNHNQLATAIATVSTCETENWLKYVQNMLKNYKDETNGGKTFNLKTACEITNAIAITEGKECPVNFAKSCLPNYVAPAFEAMYDGLILNCSCSLKDGSCTVYDQNLMQTETLEVQKLGESCQKDPSCPNDLLKFDKICTETQRKEAMGQLLPCFMGPFTQYSQAIENYFNYGGSLGNVSPCKTMKNVLDQCFVETSCFSQQEMNVIRNLVAMLYHKAMRSLTLVADELGNLTEFVDSHNDLTLQWYDFNFTLPTIVDVSEPSTKKVLDLADHLIEDYNANYCLNNQRDFETMARDLQSNENSYTARIYNGSTTTAKMSTEAMDTTSKVHTKEMETTGKLSTEETTGNGSPARFLNMFLLILPFAFMFKLIY